MQTAVPMLTYQETAKFLGVSLSTVRNWVKNPQANFPAPVIFGPRTHLFRLSDLQLYAQHGAKWTLYAVSAAIPMPQSRSRAVEQFLRGVAAVRPG